MKRITISLPDNVALRLVREARRTGTSVSQIVREALVMVPRKRRVAIAAVGRSGMKRTARNAEAALAQGFASARDR